MTPSGIALGFLALGLSLFGSVVVVTLLRFNIWALHGNYRLIIQGAPYNGVYYVLGFVALTIAITSSLYIWFRRKVGQADLYAGGLLWWMALAVLTSLYLPGASYLFTLPLLFGVPALVLAYRAAGREGGTGKQLAVLCACAIPGLVLLVPVIKILYVALPPLMFGAVSVFVVLLLGLLLPLVNIMSVPRPWVLPGLSVLLSLLCIAAGTVTSGFSRERPRPGNIFYALNADTNKAVWASTDGAPDEWSAQFFTEGIKRGSIDEYAPSVAGRFISSQAPAAPLPAPDIALLGDEVRDGVRTLSMRVTSARRAPFLALRVDSETGVVGTSVNGRRIEHAEIPAQHQPDRGWRLFYYAPPAEGVELSLQVRPAQPVRLRVTDQSFTLPPSLMASLKARPDGYIPTPYPFNPLGDATLVSKTFSF